MAPLGLERGLPKERTQARHRPTALYYRDMRELTALAKEKVAPIAPHQLFRLQEVRAELQAALVAAYEEAMVARRKAEHLERDYTKEVERATRKVQREVNLIQLAASMGYQLDKKASSDQVAVMQKGKERIAIALKPDKEGKWTYHSLGKEEDQGTVVDFMQGRGYNLEAIRQLSSKHLAGYVKELPTPARQAQEQPLALERAVPQIMLEEN